MYLIFLFFSMNMLKREDQRPGLKIVFKWSFQLVDAIKWNGDVIHKKKDTHRMIRTTEAKELFLHIFVNLWTKSLMTEFCKREGAKTWKSRSTCVAEIFNQVHMCGRDLRCFLRVLEIFWLELSWVLKRYVWLEKNYLEWKNIKTWDVFEKKSI